MRPLAAGIVGSRRSRNGLGPFLATFLERAGCRVTAVAGRSPARAQEDAAVLGERLGHPVQSCRDLDELCASGISALVIASPPEHHLPALEAALSANLPVLCEKPLVHERHLATAASVVSRFVGTGILLAENCHWPFVLPALPKLYDHSTGDPVRHLSLGLAPPLPGRVMVQNNLPHVLSLAQAVAPVDADTTVDDVSLDRPSLFTVPNMLRFRLRGPYINLKLELHLDICPNPPRPAWLAINGVRMDRRIGRGYTFSFAGNGHEVSVADPMQQLVSRFSEYLRMPNSTCVVAESEAVRQRLRLYSDILSRLP
jgi:Oxidoreductase family, NAD-binding Rossmann fold